MQDMLVPLYKLPPRPADTIPLDNVEVQIRRPKTFEMTPVLDFIRAHFGQSWVDEVSAAFSHQPVSCFVAVANGTVTGFAAYDVTHKAFFGPTGVDETMRGKGIGKALLLHAMWGLYDMGYAYGIIGAAGPMDFYAKAVHAAPIPDSWPGIYANILK